MWTFLAVFPVCELFLAHLYIFPTFFFTAESGLYYVLSSYYTMYIYWTICFPISGLLRLYLCWSCLYGTTSSTTVSICNKLLDIVTLSYLHQYVIILSNCRCVEPSGGCSFDPHLLYV
jgi:hypothetical protein